MDTEKPCLERRKMYNHSRVWPLYIVRGTIIVDYATWSLQRTIDQRHELVDEQLTSATN